MIKELTQEKMLAELMEKVADKKKYESPFLGKNGEVLYEEGPLPVYLHHILIYAKEMDLICEYKDGMAIYDIPRDLSQSLDMQTPETIQQLHALFC